MATNSEIVNGQPLQLIPAVSAFYALQSIEASPKFTQGDMFLQSQGKFIEDFTAYKREFENKLARVLFDYLALACFGEARHATPSVIKETVLFDSDHGMLPRNSAYHKAPAHDPKKFLPFFIKLFKNRMAFPCGSVGGESWAKIAEGALMYFTKAPAVFIDHVVDLSHNGGICFDKPVLINMQDDSVYLSILDRKANDAYYSEGPLDDETAELVNRAVSLGFIKFERRGYYSTHKLHWPAPVKWGRKNIIIKKKKVEVKNVKAQKAA